jgi:DMSO reductase family type II enzyme heme b subunit
MEWSDPTPDKAFASAPFFLDAIALQFVEGEEQNRDVPFFGMGEKGKPVNIWHWRADAMQQVDRDSKSTTGREDEVIRLSLDPFRRSSVEELNAEGFGRLSVQSLEDQQVSGRGVWAGGRWRVVLIRNLKTPGSHDVQFEEADSMLLALALWDGSARDKSASKAVSLWRSLKMK